MPPTLHIATRLEELVATSRSLAPDSKRGYLVAIRAFLEFAGRHPANWTPATVERWAQQLAVRVSPRTANTQLYGLKWVSKRYHEVDQQLDFAAPIEAFPAPPGTGTRPSRVLTRDEMTVLFATCDGNTWSDVRDRAILCLGCYMGLRRHEIAGLLWSDYDAAQGVLTVRGKGRRVDVLEVERRTKAALAAWRKLATRFGCLQIFVRSRPPVGRPTAGITPNGVYDIVKKRAARAGIESSNAHMMRHSFVTHALAAGVPLWRVQKAARHVSPATTGIYIHDVLVDEQGAVGDAIQDGEEP